MPPSRLHPKATARPHAHGVLPSGMAASDEAQRDGTNFHHPYSPYDVQLEFMRAAYDVLERGGGQVGILESPTGTGKSLSLICASMTWLRDFKRRAFEASTQIDPKDAEGEPDWIIEQMLRRKRNELVAKWEEREARLEAVRRKERATEERGSKRRRVDRPDTAPRSQAGDEEGAEFLIDDWEEGDGGAAARSSDEKDGLEGLSKETRALMQKIGMGGPQKPDSDDDDTAEEEVKVVSAQPIPIRSSLTVPSDLLHIQDSFSTDTVHLRIAPAQFPICLTYTPEGPDP